MEFDDKEMRKQVLTKRLQYLFNLPDGSSDDDFRAITQDTMTKAETVLNRLLEGIYSYLNDGIKYFEIFPTNSGGVQFEIDIGTRSIEIEIVPEQDELLVLMMAEEHIPSNKVRELISWLHGEQDE